MTANAGRRIQLTWGGQAVPGVREKAVALNGEPIDITSDDSLGWRELLADDPAENQVNISVSGVTKSFAMKQSWFGNDRMKTVTITYPDGGVLTGEFYLATYTDTGPYNDATTFEAELQSSGVVSFSSPNSGT